MILLKLACDKCNRKDDWDAEVKRFTPTDVRRSAQSQGWRYHKRCDLCPECALKVLGVIGAMCAKKP